METGHGPKSATLTDNRDLNSCGVPRGMAEFVVERGEGRGFGPIGPWANRKKRKTVIRSGILRMIGAGLTDANSTERGGEETRNLRHMAEFHDQKMAWILQLETRYPLKIHIERQSEG